jgi:hypothetical protein
MRRFERGGSNGGGLGGQPISAASAHHLSIPEPIVHLSTIATVLRQLVSPTQVIAAEAILGSEAVRPLRMMVLAGRALIGLLGALVVTAILWLVAGGLFGALALAELAVLIVAALIVVHVVRPILPLLGGSREQPGLDDLMTMATSDPFAALSIISEMLAEISGQGVPGSDPAEVYTDVPPDLASMLASFGLGVVPEIPGLHDEAAAGPSQIGEGRAESVVDSLPANHTVNGVQR